MCFIASPAAANTRPRARFAPRAAVSLPVLGLTLFATLQTVHAQVQTGDADGAGQTGALAEVSVTAKGYAASDAETPIATTVLTADDLARKQAQNLGEALRGEAGLSVSLDGAQGQNPVIRGLQKDSVVLMVDGMRLNHAIPGFTGAGAMPAQRKL